MTAATTVYVDGKDSGREFEGIGAVSAGANTRLLRDYEEAYRNDILDLLFKPKYGASLQHLKVEIGGGTNSTSGAEASHAITQAELAQPVSRGYEFWFMREARNRKPEILLDCLPWTFPYWLSSRFSQDTADYFAAFLQVAREEWNMELDWVAAAQNESGTDLGWVTYTLRPTMDTMEFEDVKIQSPDNSWAYWQVFDEFNTNPDYDAVVRAVGYHYIDGKDEYPPPDVIATGKPLWSSEDGVGSGTSWTTVREMVARMNRYYIRGRITKMEIWCPIDSCAQGVLLGDVGVMQADRPWSGYYAIRPAIWGIAHYTQFTEPGWAYIDSGCGYLSGAGNYAMLKEPESDNWSIVLYAQQAEDLTFVLSGGLSTATVHVWKSTESDLFVQQPDITQVNGSFTLNCQGESLYSLTTTTGQQKGQPVHPIPPDTRFPLPYTEDFENYSTGATPKYLSDMQGTFETAICKGGREGTCLEQIVPQVGYTWAWDWCNPPVPMTLLPAERDWENYEAGIDVFIESGEVFLAVREGSMQKHCGYALVVDKTGQWRVAFDDVTSDDAILERGTISPFDGQVWHNLKVRCIDKRIDAYLDGMRLYSFEDSRRYNGQVCFGGSFDLNQYDNLSVVPAGPQDMLTKLDDTDPSLNWSPSWWDWSSSEYYGGSCKFTEVVGANVEFPFIGRLGRVIGLRRNDLGHIDIYVDDVYKISVDCYSTDTQYQTILYETELLPFDEHIIRVEVTGEQNPESSGIEIVLDAFAYTDEEGLACPIQKINLALGATTSASSIWSDDYTAEKANDDDYDTRWNSAGWDVDGSWLEFDFGKEVTFSRTRLTQYDDRILNYSIQYYDGQWKDAYIGASPGHEQINIFPAVSGTKTRLLVTDATTCPSIYEFEVYAAEGDFDDNAIVDLADFALLCSQWLQTNCSESCDCSGTDLFHDGSVNLSDFSSFSQQCIP